MFVAIMLRRPDTRRQLMTKFSIVGKVCM